VALIQIPIRGTFLPDPWDTANNIKREIKSSKGYSKFTTVKGILKFKDLKPKARLKYEKLKQLNRGRVFNKDIGLNDLDPQHQMEKKIYDRVIKGDITETYLNDSAELLNKKKSNLYVKLNKMLKDNNLPTVSYYLNKAKKEQEANKTIKIDPSNFV